MLSITVLRKGGKLCVLLGNYHKKLSGEIYDLIEDFQSFMKKQNSITRRRLKRVSERALYIITEQFVISN